MDADAHSMPLKRAVVDSTEPLACQATSEAKQFEQKERQRLGPNEAPLEEMV
jgi:hypothetical protein